MNKLSYVILFFLSTSALADEASPPEFQTKPDLYANVLQIANSEGSKFWVTDQALVEKSTNSTLKFWLSLYGQNYHMCNASGEAQLANDSTYQFKSGSCTLTLSFDRRSITIEDENGECKTTFCGGRGYFNGKVLFRATPE